MRFSAPLPQVGQCCMPDQWLGPTPLAAGSAQPVLEPRSSQPAARLAASVCEKWVLASRCCVDVALRGDEMAGRWTQASGTLNTLIDDPRFLWLLLVATWWCCAVPAADRAVKDAAR